MQVRGAGCHDHAGQFLLLDVLLDQFLSQAGAHEFIITRDNHALVNQVFSGPFTDLSHIDHAGNIAATVADVHTNAFLGFLFFAAHSVASSLPVVTFCPAFARGGGIGRPEGFFGAGLGVSGSGVCTPIRIIASWALTNSEPKPRF